MTRYTMPALLLLAVATACTPALQQQPGRMADAPVATNGPAPALVDLRTAPERTDYRETTRYDDVVRLVDTFIALSPVIHRGLFGYTLEGRALPLAVVGRLPNGSPESVRASGSTVVYLQGNIHAGEVEGKEVAADAAARVARVATLQLLDSLVLLVAPIYNADGNERVRLTNRPAQHGPVGGMGSGPTRRTSTSTATT
jgi:hypothetical protein